MEIVIHRAYRKDGYTIGKMYIDGAYFCDTLEDTDRGLTQDMQVPDILGIKIKTKTAIPTGEYILKRTYSPRFKRLVPQVLNVKGFSGVRIHAGNSAKDTEGCPLVGYNTQRGKVLNSRKVFTEFDVMLQVAGGEARLHIVHEYERER